MGGRIGGAIAGGIGGAITGAMVIIIGGINGSKYLQLYENVKFIEINYSLFGVGYL
jgi:hypothetical protein